MEDGGKPRNLSYVDEYSVEPLGFKLVNDRSS